MLRSINSGSGEQAGQGYRVKEVQRHCWKPGETCWRKARSPSETTTGKGMEKRLQRGLTIRIVHSRVCQEGATEPHVQTKQREGARGTEGQGNRGAAPAPLQGWCWGSGVAAGPSRAQLVQHGALSSHGTCLHPHMPSPPKRKAQPGADQHHSLASARRARRITAFQAAGREGGRCPRRQT